MCNRFSTLAIDPEDIARRLGAITLSLDQVATMARDSLPPSPSKEDEVVWVYAAGRQTDSQIGGSSRHDLKVLLNDNVAPTDPALAISDLVDSHTGQVSRVMVPHVFGLNAPWDTDKLILNARVETLAEKPTFKTLLAYQRCIVLADGYYEWKDEAGKKVPHIFKLKSGEPLFMAGLYAVEQTGARQEERRFAIITCPANELVEQVHDRMPAIVGPDVLDAWLDPTNHDIDMLASLLRPYPADQMEMARLSGLPSPRRRSSQLQGVLPLFPGDSDL